MSDITCPYCKHSQEINHDDGYGYEEDTDFYQECVQCDKGFKFQTSISFSYDVFCEVVDHELELFPSPKRGDFYTCKHCEYSELRNYDAKET